jgi:ParB/RepB/Spo0J family partition protein
MSKLQAGRVTDFPVSGLKPDPHNPRRSFDAASLKDLAANIKAQGILQPITVRVEGRDTFIVMGERRWRAAKMAGLKVMPVILGNGENKDAVNRGVRQILENVAREGLAPLDIAEYLDGLRTREKKTPNELVKALQERGLKDAGFLKVQQLLELVKLPAWAKTYMRDGRLSEGGAQAIVPLLKWPAILAAAKEEIDGAIKWRGGMSSREVKDLATDAIRSGGEDLTSSYGPNPRKFPLSVCNGCEFKVRRGQTDYCVNPAEYEKKNAQALKVQADQEKAAERKADERKANGKLTKAEEEKIAHRSKRFAEIKQQKLATYLDKWLRAKVHELAPKRLPLERIQAIALWMACSAPEYGAPSGDISDMYYGPGSERASKAERECYAFRLKYKLADLHTFIHLGADLTPDHWRDMLAAAIRTTSEDQLRQLAHAIQFDLAAEGYVIDMDYLNIQRKAPLLQLAKQGGVEDASGTMGQLKAKILAADSVKRIGVPSELEKIYRKAPKVRAPIQLLSAATIEREAGPAPSLDEEETAALAAAAPAALEKGTKAKAARKGAARKRA